ncbi:MAG TPA: quinone oxidoreductase [Intrasporangiaceae bacterium]|nr:quinone oxidoreductase [Intrasporangiaceae bacterium]
MTERALVVTTHGDRGVLAVEARTAPEPGPGEVAVTVEAVGVNFIDVYQREGAYPIPTPFVLGSEGAGVVAAVGPQIEGLAVGDRVAWAMVVGSAASTAVLPADKLVPVPDGVSSEDAAAAMLQGMTAHYLAVDTYAVRAGDFAVVHAAAGGVGQLLTQLVVSRGGRVIATAGTDEKCEIARGRGAEVALNYREVEDLAAAVREATGGRGVDVVYDGVGASTFEASLASLRPRGVLALYGAASGPVPPLDPQRLNAAGSVYLTRPSLAHYILTREELLWRAGEVLAAVADGSLELAIGGRYPLDEAAAAYEALESRASTGKLLLIP